MIVHDHKCMIINGSIYLGDCDYSGKIIRIVCDSVILIFFFAFGYRILSLKVVSWQHLREYDLRETNSSTLCSISWSRQLLESSKITVTQIQHLLHYWFKMLNIYIFRIIEIMATQKPIPCNKNGNLIFSVYIVKKDNC